MPGAHAPSLDLSVYGYVVMPEHVHLLLTPAPGVTLERSIQFIKEGYSHTLGLELSRKGEVWQRGFTDPRIRDTEDFENHRNSAFPGFKLDS